MTDSEEEAAVRRLGDAIGYGRVMQLAEQEWRKILAPLGLEGAEHSTGPCVALMAPCPHPGSGGPGNCEWCCGAGRVTQRVLKAIKATEGKDG